MLFHVGLGVLSGCLLTLTLGPGCPLVGLGGPGMVKSVLEDLVVVLEVVVDGLVSIEWSCKDLIPIGILLSLFEGIFLMVVGMLETWRLVLWTACAVGMSMPVPAVGDSICRHDESATTSSAGDPSESLESSAEELPLVSSVLHSLLLGKGMDRLLQMVTCGLPCRQVRAASL